MTQYDFTLSDTPPSVIYSKNKDATVPDRNYEELDIVTISEKKDTTLYAVWKLVPKYGDH